MNYSVTPVAIEEEMQRSYLDYAMSVIVSRALPDCRDGLKPVHRRILYAMYDTGNTCDKPYRKSARIVGEVMSKYHPHGDAPIYSSMVRMAQDFSLRDLLIDGQGNFGSIDGDSPAQMRYTEVRLTKLAEMLMTDIGCDTVDFQDNYDGAETEPRVLPARFPNLLVNGANGIAVGMATNIPPHNMGEVLDACIAYVQDNTIDINTVLSYIKGPDFPTGGEILGSPKIRQALSTGKGGILLRGETKFEDISGRKAIIITSIPYQVNKAELIKAIEKLCKEKTIDGISEIRDETNKLGIRVVIELKREAVPDVILNQLYRNTQLQSSFSVNTLALVHGRPMVMNVLDIVREFVAFRETVVTRRIKFLLNRARDKAHILIGLAIAVDNIDEVIAMIKAANDPQEAKVSLMKRSWPASGVIGLLKLVDDFRNRVEGQNCYLTAEQAQAILDMKLQRLTGLEKNKIENDLSTLSVEITDYLEILGSRERLLQIIESEFVEVREKFATPRRTTILENEADVDDEDLIQLEEMVVTITQSGYIKRVPLNTYRAQRRGGKGRSGVMMQEDDMISEVIATTTHTVLLFFSNFGKVYQLKVYKLPIGTPQSKGRALINILQLASDEKITNVMPMPEDKEVWSDLYIIFATKGGNARRNLLSDFAHVNAGGKIAIRMDEGDSLVGVVSCMKDDHIIIATSFGKSIRFPVTEIRVFKSRTSDGVRAVKLAKQNDYVISIAVLKGIEIEQAKRDEYLKIPLDIRREFASVESTMLVQHKLSEYHVEQLSVEEFKYFAVNEEFLCTVTENGYGRRTSAYEYRVTRRGGSGIANAPNSLIKGGKVVSTFPVGDTDEMIIMAESGTLIRIASSTIRVGGRAGLGVKIISVASKEKVISVTKVVDKDSLKDDSEEQNVGAQLQL